MVENAKILIANTAMDTDKIKIYGSRVRVDSMNKVRDRSSPQNVCVCVCVVCFLFLSVATSSGEEERPSKEKHIAPFL